MCGAVLLSTSEAAALASVTRHTVLREVRRGNLGAEKVGRTWVIEPAEAERWVAQFRPYAELREYAAEQDAAAVAEPATDDRPSRSPEDRPLGLPPRNHLAA
jgi:excisionase family DNA binding protein